MDKNKKYNIEIGNKVVKITLNQIIKEYEKIRPSTVGSYNISLINRGNFLEIICRNEKSKISYSRVNCEDEIFIEYLKKLMIILYEYKEGPGYEKII